MDGSRPDPNSSSCVLSLILPAYNEADVIVQAIREADAALASINVAYEIIVVDDGSRDRTATLVEHVASPRVRLIRHEQNHGYGAALRTGFSAARGKRIAFTDADCQFDLGDLGQLLTLTDRHPIAVGYRVDRQDPWLRRICSRGYNLLARTLVGTPVRDIDCALKVFRREALMRILPESTGFFVNTEMLTRARQQGLSIAEVGVRHRPRAHGTSKVRLTDIPKTLNALVPFWWSRVQFAGPGERARATAPGLGWLCVLAMAAVLLLGRLGSPLLEPEEARYAEIPRQMLAEGRFTIPVWHGEDYLHKPPLLYWLVMGSYQLFGVNDAAARLVPALASLLVVLITLWWARRTIGPWAGLCSALVLTLSPQFVYLGGMLNFDSLLSLWIVLGLACAHLACHDPKLSYRWWFTSALVCGLGCLTKGPVALVLILTPVLLFALLDRRSARISLGAWLAYLGVSVGVAAPWFVALALESPQAFADFFWLHHVQRFLTPFDHEEPIWFFLPRLAVGMLPWSLLLVPMVPYLMSRNARAARRRPAALGFFLLTFAVCLGLFSLSGSKRPAHIAPALPLFALTLGTFLSKVVPARLLCARARALPAFVHTVTLLRRLALAVVLLGLGFVGVAAGARLLTLFAAGSVVVLLLLVGWQMNTDAAQRPRLLGGGAVATLFGLLALGVLDVLPAYHRRFGLGDQVHETLARMGQPPTVVATYPKRWDSISFYLQRDDVVAYTPDQRGQMLEDLRTHGQTLLFVKRQGALPDLLRGLAPSLEFVPQGSTTGNVIGGLVRRKN